MNNSAVVIIPIYKEIPLVSELSAIKQCFKVLGRYPIFFICYKGLDLSFYEKELGFSIMLKPFPKKYFTSIAGYNTLLKSHHFYWSFRYYKYMLIYQPDAWVFKDELNYWCSKEYDYIGAPWFNNFSSHEDGSKLWKVGNGGFSLRRIEKFLELTNKYKRLRSLKTIFTKEIRKKGGFLRCISLSLGWHNVIGCLYNSFFESNEDRYFCLVFEEFTNLKLSVPSVEESCFFSFEKSPSYLYDLTNHTLPFGCHAWQKYEPYFWKEIIEIE